jgi:hypothetical protein
MNPFLNFINDKDDILVTDKLGTCVAANVCFLLTEDKPYT